MQYKRHLRQGVGGTREEMFFPFWGLFSPRVLVFLQSQRFVTHVYHQGLGTLAQIFGCFNTKHVLGFELGLETVLRPLITAKCDFFENNFLTSSTDCSFSRDHWKLFPPRRGSFHRIEAEYHTDSRLPPPIGGSFHRFEAYYC